MKVHNKIVVDIFTGKVLEDEWFDYEGRVAQCKGESSSESKPLPLNKWMQNTLYPTLESQYGYLSQNYPAQTSFEDWLTQNKAQTAGLQSNLAGAQSSLGNLSGLTQNLMTPESYSASMQPFLNKAYQGIGYSGMPGGSYADKTLAEATQQGYMQNLGNILGASQAEQAQRGQVSDILNALNTITGQQYAAKIEPIDFLKQIEAYRYGGKVEKSSQESGGLLSSLF